MFAGWISLVSMYSWRTITQSSLPSFSLPDLTSLLFLGNKSGVCNGRCTPLSETPQRASPWHYLTDRKIIHCRRVKNQSVLIWPLSWAAKSRLNIHKNLIQKCLRALVLHVCVCVKLWGEMFYYSALSQIQFPVHQRLPQNTAGLSELNTK